MRVHTFLGNGFPEIIYQRCLAIELGKEDIEYKRELEKDIYYDNINVGTRTVDFLIEDKVLVELKTLGDISENHYAQILNYLKAYKLEVGLLINFGSKSLQFKRFINSKIT